MDAMSATIHIIGGGLAGSEAAWQSAQLGAQVVLHEMRPLQATDAHRTDGFAELVCSNSFRSDDWENNAVGLLHEEMRRAGSLILRAGDAHRVPAGGALAVDRDGFSQAVTHALEEHPRIEIRREEISSLPPDDWRASIIATGPLTSPLLAEAIRGRTGEESLAFFDAIAPVVHRDSIDIPVAWMQSRYDKGDGADYINCPLDEAQYGAFIAALLAGEKTDFKEWEASTPYFEGCLPIEVMAARGAETLRFGPMKPVGLTDPSNGKRPHAVVQLRQDNALGTLWNIVGFQTKLKHGEQTRIFRMPRIRFAGQITGVEGYVESAAIGLLAGRFTAAECLGIPATTPPPTTALGALLAHITQGADAKTFQPMNINFGLFPDLDASHRARGRDRKKAMAHRALNDLDAWLDQTRAAAE
jgi:methylenetetrahydrofolate--tRNA-(uracil-5-)-methyltransferase